VLIEIRRIGVSGQSEGFHLTEKDWLPVIRPLEDFDIHIRHEREQFVAQFDKAIGDGGRHERTVVEEMFLHAIGPEQLELRAGAQPVVELRDLGTADAGQPAIIAPRCRSS
jgi:hypothetical protein